MPLHIRRAGLLDRGPMADILTEIIATGGQTALSGPVTRDMLGTWMARSPRAAWHVAEDDAGLVLGFQWVDPHPTVGEDVAHIATFARRGHTGIGIGSALFKATGQAARALGFAWINAEIRADNASGLTYYQSRGFEEWGRIADYCLPDGTRVGKVLMRYDL